ncbi:MAG: endopeptidase La [Spirochaetes bacterium GWF1_31_7]|nr:MAG: endopeptidase La [Spirochaetes bacterium GWE1_32_154]OHD46557.1 MAG: endopeptidase La [Spirochaetes bacterium GWF1_31_7]OHD49366.1 MAG: endopeptidase La [Spirochaetes bacterium GWE2_31_10]HBD93106.1 endopeptidase La [Spirochaetia bacterium]HBI36777.1 endopeptidase La [Spirochaetia bacterium]
MKILKKDNSFSYNTLPIIPLREMVIFPNVIKTFYVGRKESITGIEKAIENFDSKVFLVTQKSSNINNPGINDLYDIGVIANIIEVKPTPDKKVLKLVIKGIKPCKLTEIIDCNDFNTANIEYLGDAIIEDPKKVETLFSLINKEFKKFVEQSRFQPDIVRNIESSKNHIDFFNNIMQYLTVNIETQIEILRDNRIDTYFSKLAELIYANIENVQLEKKITMEVRKKMEKNQKDFFLYEQMKEIQKELGNSPEENEFYNIDEFIKKLDSMGIPAEIKERIVKEQKRLMKMPPISQESGIIKNYIDTLLELPWSINSEDNKDLNKAKEILDSKHYSLTKVKSRILEFLAVRQLNPNTKGPILCFIGPPGTGKTSLSKSVADAINREFLRISLGGVRDEAEIRGHRRTYLGALPGKIIQSMKKVKTLNPVFLLDEIDKMSSDFRGDPASALLEVLDPEQNQQFVDHFLEVPYDLSAVMFICTANSVQGIPYPLLDRMELIYINSYSDEEKIKIVRNFIIPKEKIENGIGNVELAISQAALKEIIRNYTMESGVRSLQRQIASICRKTAKEIVLNNTHTEKMTISTKNLSKFLGKKKYLEPSIDDFLDIGVAHGLAWSELGGALLPIEIVLYPGKGGIILTGKLGEVMKESAQTAFSYIKSKSHLFAIKYPDFSKEYDLHIHFPEGATPKDGPSGGIAITCGILSALTKTPIKTTVAMTGEVTLTGRVLAIGGLREKSLAALRHGKKEVVVPFANTKDLQDLPGNVKSKIEFKTVKRVEDLFGIVFDSSIYLENENNN